MLTVIRETFLVDTYYGHTKDETGKWIVDFDAVGALHQIPGVKVDNLPYGEYTVEITATYNSFFDHQNRGNYELYIDAVRIYNPLGDIGNTYYAQDGEGWPRFEELRDLVISAGKIESDKDTTGVIFIDGDSANGDIGQLQYIRTEERALPRKGSCDRVLRKR